MKLLGFRFRKKVLLALQAALAEPSENDNECAEKVRHKCRGNHDNGEGQCNFLQIRLVYWLLWFPYPT
jgi:hypothetical protein